MIMKKKSKNNENILTDIRHWFGWVITTVAVIVMFHFFGIHLHTNWYHPVALLGTIVVVDYFKHKVNLQ